MQEVTDISPWLIPLSACLKANWQKISVHNSEFTFEDVATNFALKPDALQLDGSLKSHTIKIKEYCGCGLVIYFEELDQRITASDFSRDLLFIFNGGLACYFDAQTKQFHYSADPQGADKRKLENVHQYYRLYNALKSPDFADHHNDPAREIVVYSAVKGIYKIHYGKGCPAFDFDITQSVNALLERIKSDEYKSSLLDAFFEVSSNIAEMHLEFMIRNGESIAKLAKRNYAIQQSKFDFEKIRDGLLLQKDKYFGSLREILNKIFGQLIGIPISISASVLATYKLEGSRGTLALILLGFAAYVVLYLFIQFMYYRDVRDIRADFLSDFETIKAKSNLGEELIEKERRIIAGRINRTLTMSLVLIGVMLVLGLVVVAYILQQIDALSPSCFGVFCRISL